MFSSRKALAVGLLGSTLIASPAFAQTAAPDSKLTGLWLTTDFPALTEAMGDEIAIDIHLENRNLPPQLVNLNVSGLPQGWAWSFTGEGNQISAATVRPDQVMDLKLKLTPAQGTKAGNYAFKVTGQSAGQNQEVPVTLTLSEAAAAKATLEPKLPALRGTPKSSFEFQLTAKNDSREDQVFNLLAQVPQGFEAVFKEQFGSNELTSIPIKAGESKDVKLAITVPVRVEAGQYPVKAAVASPAANANVDLVLDITGRPEINLAAKEGRLSGDAVSGRERSFTYVVENTGTSPMEAVNLSATPPSGWKVTFAPEKIEALKPGEKAEVAVNMTPASNAIAGDYMVNIRANGENVSDNSEFRVTVKTSTAWGIAGLGIIAASLAAFGAAVTRYGRR
jgi:uncharacterized membrane protein